MQVQGRHCLLQQHSQPLSHRHLLAVPTRPLPVLRHPCTCLALSQGLGHLLVDSTLPVIKIGVLASGGALAARYGMLNVEARRALSELAINVFTPALMISKLGAHTDLASALKLWYVGANVILCHLIGLTLGVMHTRLIPTPENLKNIIKVSSSITNTGNLPLVLVLSLMRSPSLPFNTAEHADKAVSCIMLGLWYATLLQMPLGTLLLHKQEEQHVAASDESADITTDAILSTSSSSERLICGNRQGDRPADVAAAAGDMGAAERASLACAPYEPESMLCLELQMQCNAAALCCDAAASNKGFDTVTVNNTGFTRTTACVGSDSVTNGCNRAALQAGTRQQRTGSIGLEGQQQTRQNGLHMTAVQQEAPILPHQQYPQHQQHQLHRQHHVAAAGRQQQYVADHHAQQRGPVHRVSSTWQQQWMLARGPLLRGALSAPVMAGVVGITIGSCPTLQNALLTSQGALAWLGDVLDMLGQPLIPVLLLVLGANLSNGPELDSGAHLPAANVVGVIVTKLLLSPMLGLVIVLTVQKAGFMGADADALTMLVMMIVWSMPTAVLVHSLSLVHKHGEDEVSALLFYEYIAAALTLPLCSAVFLYVVGCCVPNVA